MSVLTTSMCLVTQTLTVKPLTSVSGDFEGLEALIPDQFLFSELIPMAIISSSDFILMGSTQQQDNSRPSSLPFSLETMLVFYDGHFLKLFISASGTTLTRLMLGRKQFNPHKNLPSDNQHLLSRMTHSLLPSTNTSHILNFSAKLMDML